MVSVGYYEERVWMNYWVWTFFVIIILFFSVALVGRGFFGNPIERKPVPDYILLALDVALILIAINFRKLDIQVNQESVKVRYGILKKTIHVDDIVSCEPTRAKLKVYGGVGLRLGEDDLPGYTAGNAVRIIRKVRGPFMIPTNKPAELLRIISNVSKSEA